MDTKAEREVLEECREAINNQPVVSASASMLVDKWEQCLDTIDEQAKEIQMLNKIINGLQGNTTPLSETLENLQNPAIPKNPVKFGNNS